jgi:hypothetical protein
MATHIDLFSTAEYSEKTHTHTMPQGSNTSQGHTVKQRFRLAQYPSMHWTRHTAHTTTACDNSIFNYSLPLSRLWAAQCSPTWLIMPWVRYRAKETELIPQQTELTASGSMVQKRASCRGPHLMAKTHTKLPVHFACQRDSAN